MSRPPPPTLLVALAVLFQMGSAHANAPTNITAGEIARLPEYCPDTQMFSKTGASYAPTERQRRWVNAMGMTFWHMHHYCWSIVNNNRADRVGLSAAERTHLLDTAIGDSNYVLENSTPDFPLRTEVLTRMGQFAMRKDDPVRAREFFEASRQAKPDYWPAYLGLHEANLRIGRRQTAMDVLKQGLAMVPGEPHLKAAMGKLQARSDLTEKPSSPPRTAAR